MYDIGDFLMKELEGLGQMVEYRETVARLRLKDKGTERGSRVIELGMAKEGYLQWTGGSSAGLAYMAEVAHATGPAP